MISCRNKRDCHYDRPLTTPSAPPRCAICIPSSRWFSRGGTGVLKIPRDIRASPSRVSSFLSFPFRVPDPDKWLPGHLQTMSRTKPRRRPNGICRSPPSLGSPSPGRSQICHWRTRFQLFLSSFFFFLLFSLLASSRAAMEKDCRKTEDSVKDHSERSCNWIVRTCMEDETGRTRACVRFERERERERENSSIRLPAKGRLGEFKNVKSLSKLRRESFREFSREWENNREAARRNDRPIPLGNDSAGETRFVVPFPSRG